MTMSSNSSTPVDPEIAEVFSRFFDGKPVSAETIDTGRGEEDFRNTVIVTTDRDEKYVLKIVSNDFTCPGRIRMWKRTVEEYRNLGYYCPRIFDDRNGTFPEIRYQGHPCVVYAEEFSRYGTLEDRTADGGNGTDSGAYAKDIWSMTAKIAAKRLDYTEYPSAYCLFDTFSPGDQTDEVLENALEWKKTAEALPEEFATQVQRIWETWCANREALEGLYRRLPASVFQADLNATNLLVDEAGGFRGVCDFNLAGKDVFLNYLMRENFGDFEKEIGLIRGALRIACGYYVFSEEEKAAALPLYRCLKPLWFIRVEDLKEAGTDPEKIRNCLDRTEHYLTAEIDFVSYMG